jgi:diadenosine tetraphosphate (Ap4A) HIT family hydrolase
MRGNDNLDWNKMVPFNLHPRLAADTHLVCDWPLSRVLLMNDARYRWLILVPRRADAVELFNLDAADRGELTEEIANAARTLKHLTGAPKINIGALGNLVPQLHVHIVARSPGDPAWPGPVWGHSAAIPYAPDAAAAFIHDFVNAR